MERKQKKWWQRSCATVLSMSLVASSLSLSVAPMNTEAATTGTPGGVSENLLSWVDIGKSRQYDANNNVINLKDLADVTRKWVPARETFTKADSESKINFNAGMTSTSNKLVWYSTDQFNIDETEREIFSVQKNDSVSSTGFPFEFGGGSTDESPKYQNTNLKAYFGSDKGEIIPNVLSLTQPRILNTWGAVNDWALSLDGELLKQKNENTPLYHSNNSRTLKYYIGAGHSSVLNGDLSEVIVFNRKLDPDERQKVNSYLALKYGITLQSDYIASDGSSMWTAEKNEGYGYRITGIGRDDAGVLYQKQSKSVDTNALVTMAVGKTIEPSNSANNAEIPDLSFLTFSDNNRAKDYNINIDEANLPSTLALVNDTTKIAAKRMERIFKVEKNGTWQDENITLQVDGLNKDLYTLALYISPEESFMSDSTVAVSMDKESGTFQINENRLQDGSYFTFVQYIDKKDMETKVNNIDAENLQEAEWTTSSWEALQQALTVAKGVLTDPNATQKQVDEALTALDTARENLKKSTTGGPAITTSPGDTVAVIVNNKIENGAVVVDAGVTLDSSVLNGYEDNLNGATVAIENFKAEDKLEYTNVNGITGNFNPATGILTLSGKASIEDYQAILRSVTFTTTSTDQTDRNITFTLGSALAFSENGHFYEYINKDAPITWFNAKKEAEEKNYFGRKGYLVTITGKNENNFVKEKTLGLGWIGAKDIERNVDNNPDGGTFPKQIGDWRWVTGPEGLIDQGKGLKFYTGYSPGKIEPDMYSNWQSGEPNDYNGIGEYVAHIFGPKESNPGQWNDYRPNDPSVKGYVIEYGGMPEDENFALSASKKIVFVEAPTVEIIKPEGDKITTSKPIFEGSVTKGSEVTVEIKDKVGNVIDTPTVTVNPDGTWSFEPTKDLPDGDYTVEVTAEKNGKTATETKEVTVDTTVLTVGITEPIGDKVATAKPEFKGTATPGSTVTVAIKDKAGNVIDTPTVTVNPDGTWSFEPTKDLPDGDYTVEVTAEKNGKTATETKEVTVDTTVLTVGITEPIGDKVATAKPEFKGTATPGSTVTVAIKDKVGNVIDTPTVTVNPDGTWSFEPTKDLPDGDYTVEVTAEKNGKTATETKEVTVDTTVLTVGITEPIGDKVATAKPEFKGTATPGSTVTVAIKDKVGNIIDTPTVTVNPDGTWSFEPTKDLPDGDYTVEVTAEKNGKTATETKEVTVDTTALTVGITEPIGDKVATAKPEFKGTATPGSTVTVAIKDKVGNVIDTPTVTVNPDGTWSFEPTKDLPDGDYTVEITAEKDGETTSINKTITINTKTPPVLTPGLGSLIPSQGTLSPSFSSEVTDYTMNVDYATSQLSFLATPIIPGASVTTTVNGQLGTLEQIPLQVGENIIVITVTDANGNVKHYSIKIYREAYTGGGNSGGGGTWTPDPTPSVPPTPSETKTKIQVELEIDGDNPLEKTTVEIERTKHVNGDVTDFVNLTPAQALEAVEKAKQIGNSIARIVIPDVNDEVDQVTVEVPKQSLQTLRDNGLSLEISTENGHIAIPHSSMEGIDDSFYFRLVPVKKESERQAIEERAKAEQVVRETLQSDDVHVVARPMTIETNMPSRPVQVTLPLKGVNVPTATAERQAFLDQLAVFIEHSDGEKKVVFPEVVTMAKGELGLRFTVEKFSTFTIIQFEKPEVSEHEAYIKGFPNGTFGPDKNVTRAQIAIMMARILGYTEGQAVHKAPFKDVAKDHSAAGAIAFVKEQGIMNGDNNGNFHANSNITRAEMAAVVANYKQFSVEQGVAITFKDTKGHWAQWIIEANRASGNINGLEDGSFAPNAALTRAQAVVMMNRMFERGPLQGVAKPSFPDVKATHWAFKEIEEAANSHKYFIDEDGKEQLSK